ncbi:acetylornithine deacetylase [Salsipaludibacter albus]|uniref:acetylornithine deacetylase n=1 Tax=Salsipaludibacter albus TaxID=2849650 RepID=UPI001EE467C3|nr:acetylornithine deacetylase [Salsipaludibacter albus]MBY5164237.1 acetylornithine deacetylase [Salsipaludibacter albus]
MAGRADPGTTTARPPLDDTLSLLTDLVACRSVTRYSNLDLVHLAQQVLEAAGATCTRTFDPLLGKANLFATIGPHVDGGVVLSGHTDVVPANDDAWETPPFVATLRDGRVHGRGTTDMKGFIACVLAMAPTFAAADLQRPVHVALTFDEEVGCQGAPLLLEELGRTGPRPAAAIIGEPTMMQVVVGHKGCYEYTTTITGVAGHGSAPSRGVNAIWHAARYVMRLHDLADELRDRAPADSPFDPPESTLSIGTIHGGQARNVVPGNCSFDWEFRPVNDADAALVAEAVVRIEQEESDRLQALHPHAAILTTSDGEVGGLDTPLDSPAVALTRRLLDDVTPGVVPYNTEAGLFQAAGIPSVVCGPGSIDVAHRPDEYVPVDQLAACLAMLDRLAADLSTP